MSCLADTCAGRIAHPPALWPHLSPTPCSDLSECQLESVPAEVGALTRLQRLDLHSNKIVTLPPAISTLATLNRLSLHRWADVHAAGHQIAAALPFAVASLHIN